MHSSRRRALNPIKWHNDPVINSAIKELIAELDNARESARKNLLLLPFYCKCIEKLNNFITNQKDKVDLGKFDKTSRFIDLKKTEMAIRAILLKQNNQLLGRRGTSERRSRSITKISQSSRSICAEVQRATGCLSTEKQPEGVVQYKVFYGTNRKFEIKAEKTYFNNEVSSNITYGECIVEIPKNHRFGELEESQSLSSKAWRYIMRQQDSSLILENIITYENEQQFRDTISNTMDETDKENAALLFLHGYNSSFENVAIRSAQLGFDLKIRGVTAFFSWPSQADTAHYIADMDMLSISERAILKFIKSFLDNEKVKNVHIIAHSMGNQGLFRVLERLASEQTAKKFGQIILAAPDIASKLFIDNTDLYINKSQRTTVYVSNQDKAMVASSVVHKNDRLGYSPVTIAKGIDTILVKQGSLINSLFALNHSYYAEAESLLQDINRLINHNTIPKNRLKLSEKSESGLSYWLLNTQ